MYTRCLPIFCSTCRNKHTNKEGLCRLDFTVKKFKKGEVILREGEVVNSVYFLMTGKVVVQQDCINGQNLLIERIDAPFPLAAFMIFADVDKYIVSTYAATDCEVYIFSKETISRKLNMCQEFLEGFIAYNANRSVGAYEKIRMLAFKSIRAKVAYYILSLENNSKFCFDMSISDLAYMFGVERPSISRALSELVAEGVIEYNRGAGRIVDLDALKAFV